MPTKPAHVVDFRYAPPLQWTALNYPDDSHKTLIDQRGALLYNYLPQLSNLECFVFERRIEVFAHAATPPVQLRQSIESARVPVVETWLEYPDVSLHLTSFAFQDGAKRSDIILWQLEAKRDDVLTGLGVSVQDVQKRFVPAAVGYSQMVRAVPVLLEGERNFIAVVDPLHHQDPADVGGEVALWSDPYLLHLVSHPEHMPSGSLMTEYLLLGAGQSVAGALVIPLSDAAVREVHTMDIAQAQAALLQVRSFWQEYPLLRRPLQVADANINAMVIASARNILQAREIHDGLAEFQVGPSVYRSLYFVDGHFFLEAAQYLGWRAEALAGIDAILRRLQADGSMRSIPHHLKETAIGVATIVRQHELIGDMTTGNSRYGEVIDKALSFIEGLLEQAIATEAREGSEATGVMPLAYGDGGIGGRRIEYTTPCWTLTGLNALNGVAHALPEAEANRVRQLFERLLTRFRRYVAQDTAYTPEGLAYLPMAALSSGQHHWLPDYPKTPPEWHRLNPGSGTWALAHAIYPGELFAADDPLVSNFCALLEQLDDRQGIPEGTGWLPYQAVWTYAASFYAHVWLYVGRGDKALDYLYAFANHASPTRVWREEQSLTSSGNGQYFGDMPHNWASVEFIRLVRNCLVFERREGDARLIELLAAVAPSWLDPAMPIHITTPTAMGEVALTVQVEAKAAGQVGIITVAHQAAAGYAACDHYLVHIPHHPSIGQWRLVINERTLADVTAGQTLRIDVA